MSQQFQLTFVALLIAATLISWIRAAARNLRQARRNEEARQIYAALARWQDRARCEAEITELTLILARHPQDAATYVRRGLARQVLEDFRAALEDFSEAVRLRPSDAYARLCRGNLRIHFGEEEGALDDLDEALAEEPNVAETRLLRAQLRWNMGRCDDAEADLDFVMRQPIVALGPLCDRAELRLTLRNDLAGAERDCEAALAKNPLSVKARYVRGYCRHASGRAAEAMADFEVAAEQANIPPHHIHLRGLANSALGRTEAAVADFSSFLVRHADYVPAREWRANALIRGGELERALPDLAFLIDGGEDTIQNRTMRAKIHNDLGRHQLAAQDYRAALRMDSMSVWGLNNLAWLLATCPDDSVRNGADALLLAREACERDEFSTAMIVDTLAAAYAEVGQFEDAVAWQEKAIQLMTPEERGEYASAIDLYRDGKPFRSEVGEWRKSLQAQRESKGANG